MIRQAVILVGGMGTRLRSLGIDSPKPLLPVAGRPFVEHVIGQMASWGVRDVLLLAGYQGEKFVEKYQDARIFGARINVLVETQPLGTAGSLGAAYDALDDVFLMANGDSIHLADLSRFVSRPLPRDVNGRLLIRAIDDASRYGRVMVGADGRVTGFAEKSAAAADNPAYISSGCYILRRDAVGQSGVSPRSIEKDVFPSWASAGQLEAMAAGGYFIDIGTPESFAQANAELPDIMRRPAAFLDRDGVINIDEGYSYDPATLRFTPTAIPAIRRLNEAGYRVVVVTNQGGVAHGLYTEQNIHAFHAEMQARLLAEGAHIDAFFYCPFHPAGTIAEYAIAHEDRKPGAGMLHRAMAEWPTDKESSFLVGDKETDLQAAEAAGIRNCRIEQNTGDLDRLVAGLMATRPLRPS